MIEKAEMFDRLVREPGWEDALRYMANMVQVEIASATQHQFEAELCRVYCMRWNAKRDLLDGVVGYIESIQRSRDEIVDQFRKEKEDGGNNSAGY